MAKKKSTSSSKAERALKATVKKLRRRVDVAESAAERWRKKAKKHKQNAATARVECERLSKRLAKATAPEQTATPAAKQAVPTKQAAPAKTAPAVKEATPAGKTASAAKGAAPAEMTASAAKGAAPAEMTASAEQTPAAPQTSTATPDAGWSVTALRAEARRRGVTGYSRKTKAQLLGDLRR